MGSLLEHSNNRNRVFISRQRSGVQQTSHLFSLLFGFVVRIVKANKQQEVRADNAQSRVGGTCRSKTCSRLFPEMESAISAYNQVHNELHDLEEREVLLPPTADVEGRQQIVRIHHDVDLDSIRWSKHTIKFMRMGTH